MGDEGGSDQEGEAQESGEIPLSVAGTCVHWVRNLIKCGLVLVVFPGGDSYCFLLPELADPNRPSTRKFANQLQDQAIKMVDYDKLVGMDDSERDEAWKNFFLNPVEVKNIIPALNQETGGNCWLLERVGLEEGVHNHVCHEPAPVDWSSSSSTNGGAVQGYFLILASADDRSGIPDISRGSTC